MRKGLEVGIGFIITIIIAVMALVLAVQFLQTTFPQIQGLADDTILGAKNRLVEDLKGADRVFGITVPKVVVDDPDDPTKKKKIILPVKVSKTKTGASPEILIKNKDSEAKCYRVYIYPTVIGPSAALSYASKGILPANCLDQECSKLKELNVIQFSYTKYQKIAPGLNTDTPEKIEIFASPDGFETVDEKNYKFSKHRYKVELYSAPVNVCDLPSPATANWGDPIATDTLDLIIVA